MEISKYVYDAIFSANILVVGQTGCSKATFIFGNLKEVEWISKIELSKQKEKNIRLCFEI